MFIVAVGHRFDIWDLHDRDAIQFLARGSRAVQVEVEFEPDSGAPTTERIKCYVDCVEMTLYYGNLLPSYAKLVRLVAGDKLGDQWA